MANLNDKLGILRDAMDELARQNLELQNAHNQYQMAMARLDGAQDGMNAAQEKFNLAVKEIRKVLPGWAETAEKVAKDATEPPHGV